MPASSDVAGRRGQPANPEGQLVRLVCTSDGPVLVAGPVELELPDGTRVSSQRPMTAVCTCHRSRRYPFCDASHRTPPAPAPAAGDSPGSDTS